MATVYVGSARSDERGKAHGGKAGDQTGREVSTQSYYVHSKGWRVFRAKDPKKAEIIGDSMKKACNNNHIGYDQYERYDLFNEAKKVGFDLSKVNVNCETDCSELVRSCCAAAGILNLPTSGFRTGNMPKYLLATGEFVELTGSKYTSQSAYLGKGDILVTKTSGHTVVVLNNGSKYEGTIGSKKYELGDRILKNGCEGPDVKTLQEYLLKLDYDLGKYGADGDFGDCTELAVEKFQKDNKLTVDGEYGPKSHAAMMEALEDIGVSAIGKMILISGGNCYVRTAPNTSGSKLGIAKNGEKYSYGGETSGGWNLIDYKNQNGWVSGKYSKLVDK